MLRSLHITLLSAIGFCGLTSLANAGVNIDGVRSAQLSHSLTKIATAQREPLLLAQNCNRGGGYHRSNYGAGYGGGHSNYGYGYPSYGGNYGYGHGQHRSGHHGSRGHHSGYSNRYYRGGQGGGYYSSGYGGGGFGLYIGF